VAGNIKDAGIRAIEKHGKFEIHGDATIMKRMDALLTAFVEQKRMKLVGKYEPCYRIVVDDTVTV
jgi:pyrimidine/purine-5'-nucleotide nucleosidase